MARVWRDGQKRQVHIYRLVTTQYKYRTSRYSNHLNTGLVWYLNGIFMSGCQMVWYWNGGLKTGLKKPWSKMSSIWMVR